MTMRIAIAAAAMSGFWAQPGWAQICTVWGEAHLEEEWRYSPPETSPPEYLIGRLRSMTRSTDGSRIYAVDALANAVVVLDSFGRYLHRLGREGSGPGEFLGALIARETTGGVAVLDRRLRRITHFDSAGSVVRVVPLEPPVTAQDFVIDEEGNYVVSGTRPVSDSVLHVYDSRGHMLRSMGSLRLDLMDVELQNRFSDGLLARGPDNTLAFGRRTPFELHIYRGPRRISTASNPTVIRDYVAEVVERGGEFDDFQIKFKWRHPVLTSLISLDMDCWLVAVQEIPGGPDSPTTTPQDYQTVLFFVRNDATVIAREALTRFIIPMSTWRDAAGLHVLAIGMNRETGVLYPVQFRVLGEGG